MSGAESSQGPGWWQASDGRWYPPEQRPATTPGIPSPSPGGEALSTPPEGDPVRRGPSSTGSPESSSFFSRLFDLSFSRFITPSIIKLLFVLAVVVASIYALVILGVGFANLDDGGALLVILAPLIWFIAVLYARVLLEVIVVFFRIESNTRRRP